MGLPGPANTQRAGPEPGQGGFDADRVGALDPAQLERPRPGRPTLAAKYSTARAEMSSALAWNPYGVSSRTAGTGVGPEPLEELPVGLDHGGRGLARNP